MNEFDKHMILNYALRGMKADLEEAERNYRLTFATKEGLQHFEEVEWLTNMIYNLECSMDRDDTEIVE